ncbi:MAG: proline dehydrogenase family protein [Bdellovibrionales bacterium]|nr:proline dehydrogenase family protein [Bdellovibrionales bacterium]
MLNFVAKRFVAGQNADQALHNVNLLYQDGIVSTLDVLGENVSSKADVESTVSEYHKLLDKIFQAKVSAGISIKLTQLGLDIEMAYCKQALRRILEKASQYNIFVRIDMESSFYTQKTLDIFLSLQEEFPRMGIVIQAYLHRSKEDIKLLADRKASVRVCKGAYDEKESIALKNMDEIRTQYQWMVQTLWSAGCKVALATHDDLLINWAVEKISTKPEYQSISEFQMLYGLRRQKAKELASQGYRVRAYVPYGKVWFPYFYRRLRERKENLWFVLRGILND